METRYLYHHLGLGDHIICNALVRSFTEKTRIKLLCKKRNSLSVSFMFRDNPNIETIPVVDDSEARDTIKNFPDTILIGEWAPNWCVDKYSFDKVFYTQAGLDFNVRWDGFKFDRDLNMEEDLYQKLDIKESFIFMHSDPQRGFNIDLRYLPRKRIILPSPAQSANIWAWLKIIDMAEEVHVINSSFLHLIDSMPQLNSGKLVFHNYARNDGPFCTPELHRNWEIKQERYS